MNSNTVKHFFLILALLILLPNTTKAQHYYFKQLSLKDGFQSTVKCVLKDQSGFLWIGTRRGLGKYAGNELKKYVYEENSKSSIPNNIVTQIEEDRHGNVWVLTDKGVAVYDKEKDNFYTPKDKHNNRVNIYSIHSTKNGILFGSQDKIYSYDYDNKYLFVVTAFKQKMNFNIFALAYWNEDTLLCCSRWQGIVLLNSKTGECANPPFDYGKEITSMIIDSNNRVWISPYNKGLNCYLRDENKTVSYTESNSKLSNNVVLSIAERNNEIWIGTDGGGINILNTENNDIHTLEYIAGNEHFSLPAKSILCLEKDKDGNMWAGSVRNGLISIRKVFIKTYTDVIQGEEKGLSNNTILSLYEDNLKDIWIGTDGGGINKLNTNTEEFTHYNSFSGEKIASITEFSDNELLVSSFSKGVFIFNKKTGYKKHFIIVDRKVNNEMCSRGKTVNLHKNTKSSVLILGEKNYKYDINKKTFTEIVSPNNNKEENNLLTIFSDKEKTFLHNSKHIYIIDNTENTINRIFSFNKDTIINAVSEDEHNILWIGTNKGIITYNINNGQIEKINTALFKEVMAIVCNKQGKVWIGADNMLFAWQRENGKFVLYSESDGAILNEYLPKPKLLSSEQEVFIGGVRGLVRIDNNIPISKDDISELQLLDVEVNGKSIPHGIDSDETLKIPFGGNLTIKIMPKEDDIFRKRMYRYRIEGIDTQHTETYDSKLVIYSLPIGKYKIIASCTTKDGSWIKEKEVLNIRVMPPWYRSWWFFAICFVAVIALATSAFSRALKRKEDKLKLMMKEHEKQMAEEKVKFLINISHELRTPLTLIYTPLKEIIKKIPEEDSRHKLITSMYRHAQRMKNLINMVLDVSKLESGKDKLALIPQKINNWILDTCKDFESEIYSKGIIIDYKLDNNIKDVSFDKSKCEIVMNNILMNAIKHSPQNSTITVSSEVIEEDSSVRISVSDEGEGLRDVDKDKLFERFYQGNEKEGGTGIGLSYSKILIELHGGKIGAKNNKEKGATFFFDIPLRKDNEEVTCQPKEYLNKLTHNSQAIIGECSKSSYSTQKHTILIVDDNKELTTFLKLSLQDHFKKVLTASDGLEAIKLTKSHLPDIIVSDVMMPKMDGYDMCRNIKEDISISHIPIILLTARDDTQSKINGYKIGADGYLTKPFDIELLMEIVVNRLESRDKYRKSYISKESIPTPEESTFSQADESFLIKLNSIIDENISNNSLDVAMMCKEMYISRSSLFNKMKAITGMSPNEYVIKLRIERAISMMKNSDMTFTEIADSTGFATSRYFSTAFKQYTGETPTQYRKKMSK